MENPGIPNEDPMRADEHDKLSLELQHLVNAACDDVLTDTQAKRLNELLDQDPALRSQYLRHISLHTALSTTAGQQAQQGLVPIRERLTVATSSRTTGHRQRRWRQVMESSLFQAAVIIFLLVTAAVYLFDAGLGRRPVTAYRTGRSTGLVVTEPQVPADHSVDSETVQRARVVHISGNARWHDPNERLTVDSSITVGESVALSQGELELLYDNGVKLLLMGPSEFVMREGGGALKSGGVMASVPEAGHGFTIETPNGKVVDLGTEFGVVVDDFGVSEVSVFKGKVEAYPNHRKDLQQQKYELTKGRALQWSSQMVRTLEADPRRLPVCLASAGQSSGPETLGTALPGNELDSSPIQEQWIGLGEVTSLTRGFSLQGQSEPLRRPYLVSTRQYDSSNGPVTVICDIRFPELSQEAQPSFAILTRSENEKSFIDRPWNDILASCVRCNFRAGTENVEGLLETATKFEKDRELTGISWRGFRRPHENTLYRLVMRDDGVNVCFTVSEVDNPAVSKTVVCRSIFRGYKNHIALEGWAEGTVLVEDVHIFQATPEPGANRLLARFSSSPEDQVTQSSLPAGENGLLQTVPESATLVLKDDFGGDALDADRWKKLGDVVIENGAVSLGQLLRPQHIDTFHPRPYLLTRQEFTPRKGKLYVLGEIRFDDNFLQGYGGSFAVMSRCDGKYGEGPEWAVSALRTGVRCNLWPASPRRDHILEIHEKASPNTLAFLRGASLDIDPQSRSYYFCMEDDGQRAAITFQDAQYPVIRKTISYDSTTQDLRSGFVGFESCWGSRVLLDNVRIYVLENSFVSEEKP
jgi:hypothetical protein